MSELLAAAAAAMGLPEPLVERSAAARAAETGMSAEDVLTAWAGGGSVPTPAPAMAEESRVEEAAPAVEPSTEPAETAQLAIPVVEPSPVAAPAPVHSGPYQAPTLVGAFDNPMTVVIAAIGLFVAIFLVGVVGSALVQDEPGARSSDIGYNAAGENGRHLYSSLGCGSCHTQMVRPIVSDVGLGPVTLSDSNQILGTRRFGPDLTNVAARMSPSQIEAVIDGFGGHLDAGLSTGDMDDLVAYLEETSQ